MQSPQGEYVVRCEDVRTEAGRIEISLEKNMTNQDEQNRDERAEIAQAIMAHRVMIVSYANAIVRDFHLAEDISQDVAGIMARNWTELPHDAQLVYWLKETTRRKSLEALRKHKKMPVTLPDEALDAVGKQFADEQNNNEDRQRLDNMLALLQGCMQKLGSAARRIMEMRYGGEKASSCEEIAAMTGKSIQAIYASLKRCREALADCVDREMAGINNQET